MNLGSQSYTSLGVRIIRPEPPGYLFANFSAELINRWGVFVRAIRYNGEVKYLTKANLANLLGLAAGLYLVVILVGVVKRNHDLQLQINNLNAQITDQQTQKDQLAYQIRYYQTDAFKEKQARAKLGLQQPGESLIILPKQTAAAGNTTPAAPKPKPKSNFVQWLDFLFGN